MLNNSTIVKTSKKLLGLFLAASCITLFACNKTESATTAGSTASVAKYVASSEESDTVIIEMDDDKQIVIQLEPKAAPITVDNFKKLVKEKFFDGITFHRAVPGFVIQGGDPNGDGTGGSPDTITGEFAANGVKNELADNHERGVVSMARTAMDMNSASSQFFIVLDSNESISHSLNGQYAAFGKVIEGMDVVDSIATLETNNQVIVKQPKMNKVYFAQLNPEFK